MNERAPRLAAGALIAFAIALGSAATASAGPVVRLEIDGTCPARADAEAALQAEGIEIAPDGTEPEWIVAIASPGPSRLAVWHAGQGRIAARSIESDDCAAVADAFALIVGAQIATATAAPAGPPGTAPAIEASVEPVVAERASAGRTRLSIGAGVGAALSFEVPSSGFGQLDVGIGRGDWEARVAATADTEHELPGRWFERRSYVARAEVGKRDQLGPYWLRGMVGGGVAISDLRPGFEFGGFEPPAPMRRLHPVLAGSVAAGRGPIRAEATALVYPVTDRYLYMGTEMSHSPRVSVMFAIGVEFDLIK